MLSRTGLLTTPQGKSCLLQSHPSPAVQEKLRKIQTRIARLTATQGHIVDGTVRPIEDTLKDVTVPLNAFSVDIAPRELSDEEKLKQAIKTQDFNTALHLALLALNVDTLINTCH